MDKNLALVCPICQSIIKPGAKTVRCGTCAAIAHQDCWEHNGRCPTRGCTGSSEPYTAPESLSEDPVVERLLAMAYVAAAQHIDARVAELLREAKALSPEHPGVLELEGDLAVNAGNLRDAEALYHRAFTADPSNSLVEEKYATVMVKLKEPQFLATLPPDDEDQLILWVRRVPRNPWASAALSALLPGLGQWYNGDLLKGIATFILATPCGIQIAWTFIQYLKPIAKAHVPGTGYALPNVNEMIATVLHGGNAVVFVVWLGIWVFSLVDAALIARQSNEEAKAFRLAHPAPPRPTALVPPTKPPTPGTR